MTPRRAPWIHGHEAELDAYRAAGYAGITQAKIPGCPEFTGEKWTPPTDQSGRKTNQK